jgi:hypothetical protein
VGYSGFDDVAVSRLQDALSPVRLQRHLPFEHLHALFFAGVQVGRRRDHVGRNPHLESEQLAAGLGTGPQELDALLANRVLYLPG